MIFVQVPRSVNEFVLLPVMITAAALASEIIPEGAEMVAVTESFALNTPDPKPVVAAEVGKLNG